MKLFGLQFDEFRGIPGWFTCSETRYLYAEEVVLTGVAKQLISQAKAERYELFCGWLDRDHPAHELFAIFDINPCDLITEFRVGSHNNEESVVDEVYDQMSHIYGRIRSFHPYFVDAAGYHAVFDGRITQQEAEQIESVLTQGLEWYWSRPNADGFSIVPTLLQENEIHLWWD